MGPTESRVHSNWDDPTPHDVWELQLSQGCVSEALTDAGLEMQCASETVCTRPLYPTVGPAGFKRGPVDLEFRYCQTAEEPIPCLSWEPHVGPLSAGQRGVGQAMQCHMHSMQGAMLGR